jgi:hypothetical protein
VLGRHDRIVVPAKGTRRVFLAIFSWRASSEKKRWAGISPTGSSAASTSGARSTGDEEVDVDVDRRSWLAVVGEGEGAADRVGDLGRVEGAMDGYDLLRTFHRGHPYQCRPS